VTRRDFEMIAEILTLARPEDVCRQVDWEHYIVETVIPWLQGTNPRFQRDTFLRACGVRCVCHEDMTCAYHPKQANAS
jgi:hypothetical protein